jgi:hypothetical protein
MATKYVATKHAATSSRPALEHRRKSLNIAFLPPEQCRSPALLGSAHYPRRWIDLTRTRNMVLRKSPQGTHE